MREPRERIPDTPPDPAVFGDYTLLDAGEHIPERRKKNMQTVIYVLTGGWARGYRTQVLGFITLAGAVSAWAVGDMSLADLVNKLPAMLAGAGLVFVGDKIDAAKKAVADAVAGKKPE